MSTPCNYLYGVVPAGPSRDFGPIGLGGGVVRTVIDGSLGIVTSQSEPICFSTVPPETTLQCLAQHQRVLEQVMAGSPVIPLKFGTYADDDAHVRRILQAGRTQFADALERFASRVEIDLAAFWEDMGAVLAEIAADPKVTLLKARITATGQPTIHQRVELGMLVKQLLDDRRNQVAGELAARIQADWPNVVVNPVRDDSMLLNAALLIGRDEQGAFDQAIEALNERYADRYRFRCVGPLPPYSFATAQVKTVAAEELDLARQALGLGESASLAEIKSAYRRLVRQAHPDRNPEAGSADRMREITAACELLEEFAVNYRHAFAAVQEGPVLVTLRSVNDLRGENRRSAGSGTRDQGSGSASPSKFVMADR